MCCSDHAAPSLSLAADADHDVRASAALVHAAALLGLLLPVAGFVLGPLLAWALRRGLDPFVDQQGRRAVAFGLTAFLGCVFARWFGFDAAFFVFAGVAAVVPVYAAYQAYRGCAFRYPFVLGPLRRWAG